FFPPEKVTIRQVVTGNGLWRPSKEGDVLLLGDSFSNIFSFEAMGWGESAGLAEHFSVAFGRAIYCIFVNSDPAFPTPRNFEQRARARARPFGWKKTGHLGIRSARVVVWELETSRSKTR